MHLKILMTFIKILHYQGQIMKNLVAIVQQARVTACIVYQFCSIICIKFTMQRLNIYRERYFMDETVLT